MGAVQQAAYSLADVFRLIDGNKVVFTAPSRSIRKVIEVYLTSGTPKTEIEARDFILQGIKMLTEKHFCGSQLQWETVVVDKYGIIYDGKSWFVKFAITDGELEEISFHPPEKDLKTEGGILIPKG